MAQLQPAPETVGAMLMWRLLKAAGGGRGGLIGLVDLVTKHELRRQADGVPRFQGGKEGSDRTGTQRLKAPME